MDDKNSNNNDNRGFASMETQQQREIASKSGKTSHEKGAADEVTSEEARETGRTGGEARGQNMSEDE